MKKVCYESHTKVQDRDYIFTEHGPAINAPDGAWIGAAG
jgi:hypothetical protein